MINRIVPAQQLQRKITVIYQPLSEVVSQFFGLLKLNPGRNNRQFELLPVSTPDAARFTLTLSRSALSQAARLCGMVTPPEISIPHYP